MTAGGHIPVLFNEVLDYANCREGAVFVDANLGSGGHSRGLLERYSGIRRLIGIDCDGEAIARAADNLAPFARKTTIVQGNFRGLRMILQQAGVASIDGILFDFGISTTQLKNPGRGFGFSSDGALDMRMDQTMPLTARDLIERLPARELERVISTYGEERFARRIAVAIKDAVTRDPALTTRTLADVVYRAVPAKFHPEKIHPATRTFQALRIAVNDELAAIEEGLDQAIELLSPGGRILAISFHSLEDRIVKNRFRGWEKACTCPPGLPVCRCGGTKRLNVLTRRPVTASPEEMGVNPSSRSARLRVGERLN